MKFYGSRGFKPGRVAKKEVPDLGAIFLLGVRACKLPIPVKEHRFHSKRLWRFDFAWPEIMLAVEIEGGTAVMGRHVCPAGYRADCKKYNEALLLGWRVIRGDSKMVRDGSLLATLEVAINKNPLGKR